MSDAYTGHVTGISVMPGPFRLADATSDLMGVKLGRKGLRTHVLWKTYD